MARMISGVASTSASSCSAAANQMRSRTSLVVGIHMAFSTPCGPNSDGGSADRSSGRATAFTFSLMGLRWI